MSDLPPLNLPTILAAHAQWLADPDRGQRAYLRGANLRGANLRGATQVGALPAVQI
jgi:uncharacterized protein YjbI with pentapeptide repeats